MTRHLRRLAPVLAAVLLALPGCVRRPPRPASERPKTQAEREKEAARQLDQVKTQGINIHWREPSPDRSRMWRILDLVAEDGVLDASSPESGTFSRARGVFYRADRARARFAAPRVDVSRDHRTVVATGGVLIQSIDPAGVTMTAPRIVWRPDRNTIRADGGVRMSYQPGSAPAPTASGVLPHLTIDTELRKFWFP